EVDRRTGHDAESQGGPGPQRPVQPGSGRPLGTVGEGGIRM
ncbi:uncharacterized protein METZ01_LOCUS231726, partial [marine metagenome]